MSLLTGFAQPIEQSQQAFRLILKALSEPGHIVTLPDSPIWGALNAASTAALLTLADQETPIQLCLALESEQVLTNIRFHSGAPLANNAEEVCFALFDAQLQAADLQALPHGSEISPEFSTTVMIQLDSLDQGSALRLTGPGIEQQRVISPSLPPVLLDYLINRPQRFPLGLDFLLTCGERLLALPRTTHVEVC
ncbi:carbon-phosphorus lyase complex subunit [Serratia proteamaculans]|uniref:Phosphonate C-P lyase system protein PhnH n=1 Tax=Serratia proteamaculans TaxID=28151 RepID=A0ABS0TTN0_SERPR|nr:phosphonate C-P lyase system protein PhnH [Serratia proteamaculans]SPZ53079.1 carbon-phosphorus lyase complex subunit [Serratia quinivorans]KAB1495927.1 phosphonate C-P lyase system protein PhnH [Serratia proteamaculans]MBI6181718.1 phosphonate C-P lyase system protein PhnH [Serratia proteamaculans]NWA73023.1 phosphonate C-P lyase system protein PhnH [Serratia proteamaculans]RYM53899.1 phosphonate C-P lyase system protein PhnH [Serratia proteamaculans]